MYPETVIVVLLRRLRNRGFIDDLRTSVTNLQRPFAFVGIIAASYLFESNAIPLEGTQHWDAFSRSAEGITGDIDVSSSRIVFQNGMAIELSYVGSVLGVIQVEKDIPAKIYRIVRPKNSILLHGNRLCDQSPYYAAWAETSMEPLMEEWKMLQLTFIKGRELPTANMNPNRDCGGYAFTRVVGKH